MSLGFRELGCRAWGLRVEGICAYVGFRACRVYSAWSLRIRLQEDSRSGARLGALGSGPLA